MRQEVVGDMEVRVDRIEGETAEAINVRVARHGKEAHQARF